MITHTQLLRFADEYRTLKNEIAERQARLDVLASALKTGVPVGKELSGDGIRIIHSAYERAALNTSLLKEKAPEIYSLYVETSTVERLTVR